MNTQIVQEYKRLRKQGIGGIVGKDADICLQYAKSKHLFSKLEDAGLVRLSLVPDESADLSFLDQDEFENIREKEYDRANCDGVWGVVGEYRTSPDGEWNHADSVWGFIGEDYKDSGYEFDIMAETVKALRDRLKSRCPCCRQPTQKI